MACVNLWRHGVCSLITGAELSIGIFLNPVSPRRGRGTEVDGGRGTEVDGRRGREGGSGIERER